MGTTLLRASILAGLFSAVSLGVLMPGIAFAQQATSPPGDPAKPAASPSRTNNVRPAIKWKQFNYTCEAGAKITVYLHNTTAKVLTQDHIYMMRQTPSPEGNRYSDGKFLWWSRGDTGFLQGDTPEGDGKMLVKGCALDKPAETVKP